MIDSFGNELHIKDFVVFSKGSTKMMLGVIVAIENVVNGIPTNERITIKYPHATRRWPRGQRWGANPAQPEYKFGIGTHRTTAGGWGEILRVERYQLQSFTWRRPYWVTHLPEAEKLQHATAAMAKLVELAQ